MAIKNRKLICCVGMLIVLTSYGVKLSAQSATSKSNAANKTGIVLAIINNQRITVASNGDILSVSENAFYTHKGDTVIASYSDVSTDINRDISVWKGSNYPSVFYFPLDEHLLMRDYRNNSIMLDALDELVKSKQVVQALDTIEIIGACSPIGSEDHNLKLALSRCMALRSYLRWMHLPFAESFPFKFSIIGIDKLGYNILREQSPPLTEKQMWNRLQYAAIRLKMKDGTYIIPGSDKKKVSFNTDQDIDVAQAPVNKAMETQVQPQVRDTIFLKSDTVYITTIQYIPAPTQNIADQKTSRTRPPLYLAVKTNLLYDAAILPNLSVEWYMGNKWSLVAEGNWSWWTFDRPTENGWYHRIQVGGLELRRWFKSPYPLHGHAVGVYSMLGNYDVRLFAKDEYSKGYLSYFNWSAGLSYAYSLPIARRFNLEFGLAIGYVGGRYYQYDYCMDHDHWAERKKYNMNYIGPTRVGISLVWLLGTGNHPKNKITVKRLTAHIIECIFLLLAFASCRQKDLYDCPPEGNIPLHVVIHWDSVPAPSLMLPGSMTVHWYSPAFPMISSDMGVYGGDEQLDASIYHVMCMDFYGNTNLAFRTNGTREGFEVYNIRATGTYNTLVPQLPGGEMTVAEAYPYQFYIDRRPQQIDLENLSPDTTVTVHFYPKNVLREFTFLIYDVIGAKNMAHNSGAISGMSGSYFPANNRLATTPSTILFQRVEAIKNAQISSRWTDQEKALFTAKDPNWTSADTLVGWTRDWVVGKFVTFGPLNTNDNRFRLTVEAISGGNNHYNGAWGYWHGEWENTVAAQIDSAMGKRGTLEEQLAWRQRNGGYDIVLYNDHRLLIPEGDGGKPANTDGGFTVSVNDWGPIIDVPTTGSTRSASQPAVTRVPVNTLATIPDFVVNGIYSANGSYADWSYLFNEQYVVRPESGNVWDYSPKKYWPDMGEVNFYAYAPAGIKNFVKDGSNNVIGGLHNKDIDPVLEYVMPYVNREEPPIGPGEPPAPLIVSDKQEDLLVAAENYPSPPQIDSIPLHFHHAFSRIFVKAKTDRDDNNRYRIKVVRVEMRGINTKGELKLGIGFNGSGVLSLQPSWSDQSEPAIYHFNLLTRSVPIDAQYTTLLYQNDAAFVIPQTVPGGATLYVEYELYSVSPTNGEQYVSSKYEVIPIGGLTFEMEKQYALGFTLDLPPNP